MLGWVSELSGGEASFIGTLFGSLSGFLALLIGALFNAHLNRKRDDRLRGQEMRAVAGAIRAEFAGVIRAIGKPLTSISVKKPGERTKSWTSIPDLSPRIRVLPELLPKLGLLDVETIGLIIDAQMAIEEHYRYLRLTAKDQEGEAVEGEYTHSDYEMKGIHFVETRLIATIEKAIKGLDRYLV